MIVFYTGGVELFSFQMSSTTYPEIYFATRAVRELAFVQYLEKDHNDILHFYESVYESRREGTNPVSLFNLIEQQDR